MGSTSQPRQRAGYDGESVDGEGAGTCMYTQTPTVRIPGADTRGLGTTIFPTSYSTDYILNNDGDTAAGEDRAGLDYEV